MTLWLPCLSLWLIALICVSCALVLSGRLARREEREAQERT